MEKLKRLGEKPHNWRDAQDWNGRCR
jgi:hypothetical protein